MIKFRDRVGEVIGRLTITSRANDAYKNKIQWNCICECGNMVIVRGDSLKINHTRSCVRLCQRHISKGRMTATML